VSQTFESFGKYILLEKLAMGGMAEVYLAKNMGADGIGKLVAIKRILPQFSENPEFIDMFKDEAKIAVNLAHSNIVSIHEFGVEKKQFFLVMDFVEGRNLRQILNKMKKSGLTFSIEQVLYIIKEVASGLDSAHRCLDRTTGKPLNITHRDMSPQNVMISFEGEVKVVDFGIAKAETQIETTRAGTLKGKFGYMSPEQAEGQVVDLRTDVFSLGIVLWELLANDRLFIANNEINTLRKIRDCQIPSLRKINPSIPAELEKICNKALAKDRNLRFQTAAAFHRELSRFLNRQYPDFSPHDFSVFIKTLFASEILEHRKKVVDYSKVDLGNMGSASPIEIPAALKAPAPVPPPVDLTNLTANTEKTEQSDPSISHPDFSVGGLPAEKAKPAAPKPVAKKPEPKSQDLALALEKGSHAARTARETERKPQPPSRPGPQAGTKKLDAEALKLDASNKPLRLDNSPYGVREGTFTSSVPGYTGRHRVGTLTSIRVVNPYIQAARKITTFAFIIGAIAFSFAYTRDPVKFKQWATYYARKMGVNQKPVEGGERQEALKQEYVKVNVTSAPPSAEVRINGRLHEDVTPTTISLKAGESYTIEIKREPYLPWKTEKIFNQGEKIFADLKLSRVAYVDIVVEGAGEIYVNNTRIAVRGPVMGYQIPADEEVLIWSQDTRTGARAEERVRLGENFRKQVRLQPRAGNERIPALDVNNSGTRR